MKPHGPHPLLVLAVAFAGLVHGGHASAERKAADSIPATDLIEPGDFAKTLQAPSPSGPLIVQVGFRVLYVQAHIPGSEYAGPANDESGLRVLRARVARLPKDASIVLYCGCCPWNRCPNIGTAYDALHALGFTHVKVLHIAEDFGTDWVEKNYPIAKGE